jgi:hypothetical protein
MKRRGVQRSLLEKRLSRFFWLVAALLAAAFLAFLLQSFIREALVIPAATLLWALRLYLRSLPQALFWSIIVAGLALGSLAGLLRQLRPSASSDAKSPTTPGPVEILAEQIRATRPSVYSKWQIANQIGRLAQAIRLQQEGPLPGPEAAPTGSSWDPPDRVKAYLDAGLNRSFISYTRRRFTFRPLPFSRTVATPLDADLDEVVAYLETQLENPHES